MTPIAVALTTKSRRLPVKGAIAMMGWPRWIGGLGASLVVGALASVGFLVTLVVNPPAHFADESAYVSQSGYWTLYRSGLWNDPTWLTYAGVDLPPLTKHLVGLALEVSGRTPPPPPVSERWYANISYRWEDDATLAVARVPVALVAGVGIGAVFALGRLAGGPLAGLLAALLLAFNPLYSQAAGRAMSDAPAEALGLVAVALTLSAWHVRLAQVLQSHAETVRGSRPNRPRVGIGIWLAIGLFAGLATGSKLNAGATLFPAFVLIPLGLIVTRRLTLAIRLTLGALAASATAFGVFVAINPFVTARPDLEPWPPPGYPMRFLSRVDDSIPARIQLILEHRWELTRASAEQFPHHALNSLTAKAVSVAVQGFGRFGPLGPPPLNEHSLEWLSPRLDWGAAIWLPLCLAGGVVLGRRGKDQLHNGTPPDAWAVLVWVAISWTIVLGFIPLAWDRYYLALQPGAAVLGAVGLTRLGSFPTTLLRRRFPPPPRFQAPPST
jgi:4-amino-4-deoxy-L-arabinose transferase-like glycosyltransferase